MQKLIILEATCKKEHYVCVYTHDFNLPFFWGGGCLQLMRGPPDRVRGRVWDREEGSEKQCPRNFFEVIGHLVILEDIFHRIEIISI